MVDINPAKTTSDRDSAYPHLSGRALRRGQTLTHLPLDRREGAKDVVAVKGSHDSGSRPLQRATLVTLGRHRLKIQSSSPIT
jgi:hypothetical protein